MPKISVVETRIQKIEGFRVRILHPNGADVRGDKTGIKQYPYERALRNAANVRSWRDGRFGQTYPGFDVEVLDAEGNRAQGNKLLATVRDTYLLDD